MGVRGLTTFIARDSDRYLKHTILKNCPLIIDGSCVASHLYKWCTKRDSAFGGDYDEYFVIVKTFFKNLKKCRISPIVIFDGGYEPKKLKTVLSRLKQKLMTLKTTFSKGFSSSKFFPLFMRQIFCEAVASLKVPLLQCEFEADGEVAALARVLKCPVLSYDSDFFIYDVLYIPLSTVQLDIILLENDKETSFGFSCSIYDVEDFLAEYPGLAKCHLPLLATLLGNDFVDSHIFQKFFQQIPLSKRKNMTHLDRRILGLLNWLKHESEFSAVEKIKAHIGKLNYQKFLHGVEVSKANYTVSNNCQVQMKNGNIVVDPSPYSLNVDPNVINLLSYCRLPSLLINLVELRSYFAPLQVEDLKESSSHESAIPLIQAIDQLLNSMTGETRDFTLYSRSKGRTSQQVIKNIPTTEVTSYAALCLESVATKKLFILKTMKLDSYDQNCVEGFLEECQLFVMCLLYWTKFSNPTVFHAHSLLLGYLASQAKNRVGLFRQGKGCVYSNEEVSAFAALFSSYRKTTESGRTLYNITPVHFLNCFQSVLFHCSLLNTILGCPFTPCKLADSYSGTLLYNLHASFLNKADVLKTLQAFLSPVPRFRELYVDISDRLSKYFPPAPNIIEYEKRRRRRKATQKSNKYDQEIEEPIEEENIDYSDLGNKFYVLTI